MNKFFPMPNTSLLRLRQRLLYETLRERYFDPSLRDPSLRDATRSLQLLRSTAKLRATRRSVPNSWRRYA
ncbi:MAG: hypothetical protein ACYTX0_57705 [Nostoc sp.]